MDTHWKLFYIAVYLLSASYEVNAKFIQYLSNYDDLSKIAWSPIIRNKLMLDDALSGEAMMLQGEVILGIVLSNKRAEKYPLIVPKIPIIAHPLNTSSDLTLLDFLRNVAKSEKQKKGIKLYITTIDVLEPTLLKLEIFKQEFGDEIKLSIWLHANILRGPVECENTPIDADRFLLETQCRRRFPFLTLSIGWNTRYGLQLDGNNIQQGNYSSTQIDEMIWTLMTAHYLIYPVVFDIRAGLAINSNKQLLRLINIIPKSKILLWSNQHDIVNTKLLNEFIELIGENRVYLDIDNNLKQKLKSANLQSDNFIDILLTTNTCFPINNNSIVVTSSCHNNNNISILLVSFIFLFSYFIIQFN